MAYPNTLVEKKQAAIVSLANDIAAEAVTTVDHQKRMNVARILLNSGQLDFFIQTDLLTQAYDDTTPYATVKTRISGLITNLVALGFGG